MVLQPGRLGQGQFSDAVQSSTFLAVLRLLRRREDISASKDTVFSGCFSHCGTTQNWRASAHNFTLDVAESFNGPDRSHLNPTACKVCRVQGRGRQGSLDYPRPEPFGVGRGDEKGWRFLEILGFQEFSIWLTSFQSSGIRTFPHSSDFDICDCMMRKMHRRGRIS